MHGACDFLSLHLLAWIRPVIGLDLGELPSLLPPFSLSLPYPIFSLSHLPSLPSFPSVHILTSSLAITRTNQVCFVIKVNRTTCCAMHG
ncbi:hypothetical protein DFH08DRAFT_894641 [Mycena albidolilacea]|uniref:Secreted protein n=1 Tax=Mycena albidolilacea TaxID=1033008 RepID=A0AAD6ZBZ6_9AGAR|nr:hypothetical protein DFH08DRAFT_894641 [Mycena albidolilacea]